jgi:serine/threonine-protein kinase
MNAPRAIAIMQQVLQGVGAAHARGIVHRDLKPDNIFLVQRGTDVDFVKILDFGISKILDAADAKVRLTSTGTVVGTPIYMAPEQAMGGAIDHRADLYALGVMFYEMLAGRPPFDAPSYLALVTKHLHEAPPPLEQFRPDLPTWLHAVVHR